MIILRVRVIRVSVGIPNAQSGALLLVAQVVFSRCQQHAISPGPPNKLAELLEDEQVQDTTGSDFVVVIVRDAVPVEAAEGLGEGDDEGDG
jgi:hypothetical protein